MEVDMKLQDLLAQARAEGDCLIWQGRFDGWGYPVVNHKGKSRYPVRRLVWELYHGVEVPKGAKVLHAHGRKDCIAPEHLALNTEKVIDARAVREAYKAGEYYGQLARKHGVTEGAIRHIVHGRTHKSAGGPIAKAVGPMRKLNAAMVVKMRELRAKGVLLRDIAAQFGVSRQGATQAIKGRTWRKVRGPEGWKPAPKGPRRKR